MNSRKPRQTRLRPSQRGGKITTKPVIGGMEKPDGVMVYGGPGGDKSCEGCGYHVCSCPPCPVETTVFGLDQNFDPVQETVEPLRFERNQEVTFAVGPRGGKKAVGEAFHEAVAKHLKAYGARYMEVKEAESSTVDDYNKQYIGRAQAPKFKKGDEVINYMHQPSKGVVVLAYRDGALQIAYAHGEEAYLCASEVALCITRAKEKTTIRPDGRVEKVMQDIIDDNEPTNAEPFPSVYEVGDEVTCRSGNRIAWTAEVLSVEDNGDALVVTDGGTKFDCLAKWVESGDVTVRKKKPLTPFPSVGEVWRTPCGHNGFVERLFSVGGGRFMAELREVGKGSEHHHRYFTTDLTKVST